MYTPVMPEPVFTPAEWRRMIGSRLRKRRGKRSKRSSGIRSGIHMFKIGRLEDGECRVVPLAKLYFLARHYGCSLPGIVDPLEDRVGTWDTRMSYPALDAHVRRALRQRRETMGLGTPALTERCRQLVDPRIHQTWLSRVEGGAVLHLDCVRLSTVCAFLDTTLADMLAP